jgi:serine protease inhibitor
MMFSGVVQTNSKPDSISFCPFAAVLAVAVGFTALNGTETHQIIAFALSPSK